MHAGTSNLWKKKAESKEKENIKRFKVLLGIIKHIRCYN